jgi:hypothetical protein
MESSFGWLNGYRRLAKDLEIFLETVDNLVRIAHIRTLLKRISKNYSAKNIRSH